MWDKRSFDYKEIDVMKLEEKKWRDLYEFDTPVVCVYLVQMKGASADKVLYRYI